MIMKYTGNARLVSAFCLVCLFLFYLNHRTGEPPHKICQINTSSLSKQTDWKEDYTVVENFALNAGTTVVPTKEDETWLDTSENKPFSDYGDGTCPDNELREELMVILQKWRELASTMKIKYFLSWGTLLGAWRNADIIPYDLDVDIFVTTADAVILEKIKEQRNFSESDDLFHFVIQEDWTKPYSHRRRFTCDGEEVSEQKDHCSFEEPFARLIKGNHHLDIFEVEVKGTVVNDFSVEFKQYPLDSIFPLKKCMYMGDQVFCPNKPKVVLETLFGEDLSPDKICKDGEWIRK